MTTVLIVVGYIYLGAELGVSCGMLVDLIITLVLSVTSRQILS
jgi:hypothetical protein